LADCFGEMLAGAAEIREMSPAGDSTVDLEEGERFWHFVILSGRRRRPGADRAGWGSILSTEARWRREYALGALCGVARMAEEFSDAGRIDRGKPAGRGFSRHPGAGARPPTAARPAAIRARDRRPSRLNG
jgi:hypothetical protein